MSYLTERPELMLEVLAVLVNRAGGAVEIAREEAPGAFNLLSSVDENNRLHLVIEYMRPLETSPPQPGNTQ